MLKKKGLKNKLVLMHDFRTVLHMEFMYIQSPRGQHVIRFFCLLFFLSFWRLCFGHNNTMHNIKVNNMANSRSHSQQGKGKKRCKISFSSVLHH